MRLKIFRWAIREIFSQSDREQEVNNTFSQSGYLKYEDFRVENKKDIFPLKKVQIQIVTTPGRGKHPNSKKNLKPFPKSMSANPIGQSKKLEQSKICLGWLGNLAETDNWLWDKYTNGQIIIKGIWERASKGNK